MTTIRDDELLAMFLGISIVTFFHRVFASDVMASIDQAIALSSIMQSTEY